MSNISFKFIALSILIGSTLACTSQADGPLSSSEQMLLVIAKDWSSSFGILQRYERSNVSETWEKFGQPMPVTLGINGMAWGKGLHGDPTTSKPIVDGPVIDREGLKRSPVGVFEIPEAFGKDDLKDWPVKLKYTKITEFTYCGGDRATKNYNRLVPDIRGLPNERWKEDGEEMQAYVVKGVYTYGAVIAHNYNPVTPGGGSCFFLHVWWGKDKPGSGCTGMEASNVKEVISWLDPEKHPVIVQLPGVIYSKVQNIWGLPIEPSSISHDEL